MLSVVKKYTQNFQMPHYMVVILAVALQIQVTLFAEENYLGLRVGLADMLLPFLGILVVISLIRGRSNWPNWSMGNVIFWLVMLAFVMSCALLNGYIVNGFLSSWAFVNKYIGFFLLISYFMLGGWIATNVRDSASLFMGVFVTFFVLTLFVMVIALFLQSFVPFSLWFPEYPWDGFMANRNAFMVIFVLAFIFIIWGYVDEKTKIPLWTQRLFWLCLPMFLVFNDSRTGWIATVILVTIFFLKKPIQRAKLSAPLVLLGILIVCSSFFLSVSALTHVKKGAQMRYLLQVVNQDDQDYMGDQKRYIAVEDGLELYGRYDPLVGAGLGAYKPFQIEKRGQFIEIMDFTGLWLLVETGAVGLCVFAAFFIACIWSLYCSGFSRQVSPYHRAMFTFLVMFAAMSVLHELMYTRVIWFAMGLALASQARNKLS